MSKYNTVLFSIVLYLSSCFSAPQTSPTGNPPSFKDYTFSNATNTYYRCYGTPINFTSAVDKCIQEGAELGVPRNKLEFDTLLANFGSNIYSVWLALTDREIEGRFKTLSGIPVNEIYTNWERNEPNDASGDEDCVEMLYDGRYNDIKCGDLHAYICVKPLFKSLDESKPLVFSPTTVSSVSTITVSSTTVASTKSTTTESFVIATPQPQPQAFRNDYKYIPETGFYYKAHNFARNFSTAVSICKSEGATLAIPRSKAEADVLINQFHKGTEACWVGIHDIFVETQFQTIDDTPIEQIYINWKPSFPNYFRDDRDCLIIDNKGFYYDTGCEGNYQFVCTRHESTIVPNILCDTYDSGYFYNIDGDRCYKLHTNAANWNDSLRICRAEQASLSIINSATEAKILVDALKRYTGHGHYDKTFVHVDFNDWVISQTFMTSSFKTLAEVGYEVWGENEPDNKGGIEHCGGMLRDGKLADINCNTKALFFCEKILNAPLKFELLQRDKFKSDR